MNKFLILAFLFFVGSTFGWILEVFFRKFFSRNNPEHKWINPGFCTGPYLPLYGSGLCVLYLIASLNIESDLIKILIMGVMMTLIEYLVGMYCLKVSHERLWDYSNEWGNIEGVICPKFSLAWLVLSMMYYYLVNPYVLDALNWLSNNLAFSFFIGMFFGIFILDVANAVELNKKFKQFAMENDIIVQLDLLKLEIKQRNEENKLKYHFFNPFKSEFSMNEHLKNLLERAERIKHIKK